ncbi:hypothetical protein BZA77DRAFT_301141 [Pyronema omphalodes]|nr:hypothetical protein BZA77DRAFT_301141 [Pyronema omphalodes]
MKDYLLFFLFFYFSSLENYYLFAEIFPRLYRHHNHRCLHFISHIYIHNPYSYISISITVIRNTEYRILDIEYLSFKVLTYIPLHGQIYIPILPCLRGVFVRGI